MLYNIRYGPTIGGRPVASVRPMMSAPLAIRSSSSAAAAGQSRLLIPAGRSGAGLKPGVSLQQIQTTTGIILPVLFQFGSVLVGVSAKGLGVPVRQTALRLAVGC